MRETARAAPHNSRGEAPTPEGCDPPDGTSPPTERDTHAMTETQTDTIRDAARATAEWWAEQMFTGLPRRNAGLDDASDGAAMLLMFEQVTAAEEQGGDERRAKFVGVASRFIEASVRDAGRRAVVMSTDYGPGGEWAEIIGEAGVSTRLFPWKTVSWTYADHVVVSAGYRGQHTLIWAAPGWEWPACGAEEYVDDESAHYRKTGRVCDLPRWHDEEAHHYGAVAE